jgi:hypothetical protein
MKLKIPLKTVRSDVEFLIDLYLTAQFVYNINLHNKGKYVLQVNSSVEASSSLATAV